VALEVEVGLDPVGVARVADVPDVLADLDLLAAPEPLRERDARDALAAVVVLHREVVVEVDVEVLRAAVAEEVEHAAPAARVELNAAAFDRERGSAADAHDVDPLVPALVAGSAEVVDVGRRPENGKDRVRQPLRGLRRYRRQLGRVRGSRPGG
jgi:hypothetical protein